MRRCGNACEIVHAGFEEKGGIDGAGAWRTGIKAIEEMQREPRELK